MRTEHTLRTAIIGAGRMASTIDDEITSMDTWPSLKSQLLCHTLVGRRLGNDEYRIGAINCLSQVASDGLQPRFATDLASGTQAAMPAQLAEVISKLREFEQADGLALQGKVGGGRLAPVSRTNHCKRIHH